MAACHDLRKHGQAELASLFPARSQTGQSLRISSFRQTKEQSVK